MITIRPFLRSFAAQTSRSPAYIYLGPGAQHMFSLRLPNTSTPMAIVLPKEKPISYLLAQIEEESKVPLAVYDSKENVRIARYDSFRRRDY
jgi:hypothetical protein